jgi:hypothetical protein
MSSCDFQTTLPVNLSKQTTPVPGDAADLADQVIPIDQRRAAVTPARGGSFVLIFVFDPLDLEFFQIIDAPNRRAVFDAQATQFAPAGLHINPLAVEERRAARPGAETVFVSFAVCRLPKQLAGAFVHEAQRLVAVFLLGDREQITLHYQRGMTGANVEAPDNIGGIVQLGRERIALGHIAV